MSTADEIVLVSVKATGTPKRRAVCYETEGEWLRNTRRRLFDEKDSNSGTTTDPAPLPLTPIEVSEDSEDEGDSEDEDSEDSEDSEDEGSEAWERYDVAGELWEAPPGWWRTGAEWRMVGYRWMEEETDDDEE